MNRIEYQKEISFRFIQPHIKIPKRLLVASKLIENLGFFFEISNTRLLHDEEKIKNDLKQLCKIPKMSSFAIGALINIIVSKLPDKQIYVNVGVWEGFTLVAGMINNPDKICVGVDNFSEFNKPRKSFLNRFNKLKSSNHYFYDMDFHEYFQKTHQGKIGFYMYDGSHEYNNQIMGLKIAESFFADECIILVDDINFKKVFQATMNFIKGSSNKYKILLKQITANNGHPTYWNGIMLFQKI